MACIIRPMRLDDADDVGCVHVRAWEAAYRGGLMPDTFLDALSIAERAAMWSRILRGELPPRTTRLVAESDDGSVVGFGVAGPAVTAAAPEASNVDAGELFAINVDPDDWGSMVGTDLLTAAVDALGRAGFTVAHLWVHPDNTRACSFYERRGWADDGIRREEDVLGVMVPAVRYSTTL